MKYTDEDFVKHLTSLKKAEIIASEFDKVSGLLDDLVDDLDREERCSS